MKQFQNHYENSTELSEWLSEIKGSCESNSYSDIIFYLTWMKSAEAELSAVINGIEEAFPEVAYYGNEASGNISMGDLAYGINIACYVFEGKTTRTELVWVEDGSELSSLEDLWTYCMAKEDLCAVELIPSMSYVETMQIDGNVPSLDDDIMIFGGASVNYDDATFGADIIARGHELTRDGMAVMLYFGEDLEFYSSDILGWKGLGRLMKVTSSTGKVINEIDNVPAFSVYEKYLGLTIEDNDALVFPLIVEEDGNEFIRTPQIINPDKSMLMFANIPEGTQVRIAYGDKNTILNSLHNATVEIAEFQPEAIKSFSCAARRLFWGDEEISKETEILEDVAPVCGFYTGGEIMKFGDKLRVLNQTLAIVAMREKGTVAKRRKTAVVKKETDKSLISRLTYFSEKIVEEERAQKLLAEGLEKAFTSEYQVLYHIDVETGKTTFVHGDDEARKFGSIFKDETAEGIFENFNRFYVDALVAPEDRGRVKDVMNVENVLRVLKENNSISVNFRVRRNLVDYVYTEMRIIKAGERDGELTAILLSFRETDAELRQAMQLNEKLQGDIMKDMLEDEMLFLVDLENDRRTTIHDRSSVSAMFTDKEKYSETVARYIDRFVAEYDRKKMQEVSSIPYMQARLKDETEYSAEYRDISKGVQLYYEFTVKSFSDKVALVSLAERDQQILDRMILKKMEDNYFALFVADLDAGLAKVFKDSPWYKIGDVGVVFPYTQTMLSFSKSFEGETADFFRRISDTDYLKLRFAKEDKASYIYKSDIVEGSKWVAADELVLARHSDGSPSVFALGFSILDEEASRVQDLQADLKNALEAADAANNSKTSFLFNMSHDIRTPMNAIKGFTAMARKYVDDRDKALDYLEKIDISSKQLLTLINQVLEMSRIESGKIEFDEKPVNIKERFESLMTVISAQARAKGLEFYSSLVDIEHNFVLADDSRMGQITINIAGNAIKYTPEGGRIDFIFREVTGRREGFASFILSVQDTGIGMSEEFIDKLFEPFAREQSSTVSRIQGTGLGMSIVKELVDLQGGLIEVESELGKGTRFDILLDFKIVEEDTKVADASVKEIDTTSFEGRRILLVEDNEMNREIAKDILEDFGFLVEEAEDGDVAVEMCREIAARQDYGYYDLILMDIQMPRMDGYEATRAIRAIPATVSTHVPIIAMTANAFEEDRQNAFMAGMDEHLAKPIEVPVLLETLAKFL